MLDWCHDDRPVATTELAELYRWYHATWHGAENGRLRVAVTNSAAAERLEPHYAEMYRRVAAIDVGFSRWLTP